jgi:signal transduction histidine kinase
MGEGQEAIEMNGRPDRPPLRPIATVSTALQIVAAVVLILVAGATYYQVYASRKAVISDTERQLARLDMVFAELTGRAFEAADLLVMGAIDAVQMQRPALGEFAEALTRRIRGVRQLTAIVAFETSGERMFSTGTTSVSVPSAIVMAMLARYRQYPHSGVTISPPFRGAGDNWNALLFHPARAPGGTLTGMVAGSIDLSYFEEFYRAAELSENGSVALHLRDGTLLAQFPHIDKTIGTSFGNLPPFTEVLARSPAGTLQMEYPTDGRTRVAAVRTLHSFPLVTMVSVEQRRILGDWQRETFLLIAVALVLGGAVVILLLSLARRSKQFERLLDETHVARDMAEKAKDRLLEQISERARAEGAMRQAQRIEAIGQLTGGVAHDFNNLLMVVLGNVDILQHRAKLERNSMLAEKLSAIRAAAERGATLTGHLLAFARRQPLMPKPVDLNATILGMENLLDSALGGRGRIQFRLASDLWRAMVDQSQIELVILNLVLNARDAMPGGGLITIETINRCRVESNTADAPPPGDYVSIIVKDSGIGIPPDVLPRVFEPFFTTKPPGAGSGLGLSQVFGTARQSGGEVLVASQVGRGTTVTVDLPRAIEVSLLHEHEPSAARLKGSDATVLLVDDDDPVRAVTAAMLRGLGYRVRDVADGETALRALVREDPGDILITDLVMPKMNGFQLAAAARKIQPELQIIFISGYADQIGGTFGPHDRLVPKPFSVAQLHDAVEAGLVERRGVLSKA